MNTEESQTKPEGGASVSTGGLGSTADDLCGLCGQPGADKMALWTGGGIYWPGEERPDTEFVHAECERRETERAHAALTQPQRDAVIRAASGGVWP
jgi:hypothetical protein